MEKYWVWKEEDQYKLYQFADKERYENEINIKKFDTYQELVQYCKKELSSKFELLKIYDDYNEGIAIFQNGKLSVEGYMELDDYFMDREWLRDGKEKENHDDDDDYEVSCTACGDGGCFHCEPHRFI